MNVQNFWHIILCVNFKYIMTVMQVKQARLTVCRRSMARREIRRL